MSRTEESGRAAAAPSRNLLEYRGEVLLERECEYLRVEGGSDRFNRWAWKERWVYDTLSLSLFRSGLTWGVTGIFASVNTDAQRAQPSEGALRAVRRRGAARAHDWPAERAALTRPTERRRPGWRCATARFAPVRRLCAQEAPSRARCRSVRSGRARPGATFSRGSSQVRDGRNTGLSVTFFPPSS
jgi:hypothetical protein